MHCPSCNQDRHPIIEGDQSGRFFFTCANPACHTNLGPVQKAAPAQPSATPAPQSLAPLPAAAPTSTRTPLDTIDGLRARLAELEATIPALQSERALLRRVVRAADRRPRTRTNVVALEPKRQKAT